MCIAENCPLADDCQKRTVENERDVVYRRDIFAGVKGHYEMVRRQTESDDGTAWLCRLAAAMRIQRAGERKLVEAMDESRLEKERQTWEIAECGGDVDGICGNPSRVERIGQALEL